MSLFSVFMFHMLPGVGAAPISNSNNTNSSASTQLYEPGWVSGPRERGTINLLSSCMIILALCAWTTVHVNIEPENEVNPTLGNALGIVLPSLRETFTRQRSIGKLLAKRWVRKLGWSCVTLVFPEGTMAVAVYERKTALILRARINKLIQESKRNCVKWDTTLAYYAVMGGFVIPENIHDAVIADCSAASEEKESKDGQRSQEARSPNDNATVRQTNKRLTLTPKGVLRAAQWELELLAKEGSEGDTPPKPLLGISPDEVKDKGNANSIAKVFVSWQALWMIIQVIARAAGKLPVTLLELHTILHTFCAVVMYATWWQKPLDIDVPTSISLGPASLQNAATLMCQNAEIDRTDPLTANDGASHDIPYLTSRAGLGKLMYQRLCGYNHNVGYSIRIATAYRKLWSKGQRNLRIEALFICLVRLIYGSLHLAAWNTPFPSYAEGLIWKISACITATAWTGFVISLRIVPVVENLIGRNEYLKRHFARICGIVFVLGMIPVLFARLYMFTESFISIRRLPLHSYQLPRWTNALPHAA